MFHKMGSVLPLRRAVLAGLLGVLTLFAGGVRASTIATILTTGYGHNGELGNGGTADHNTPQFAGGLPSNPPVIAVASGANHSLALTADGFVYSWGLNSNGQLGDGTTTSHSTAVQVKLSDGTPLANIVAISGGALHSLALASNGQVYAWGYDSSGQLGDGANIQRSNPALVPGLNAIVAISAGSYHSLALAGNGKVYAWGYNSFGQLGDGTIKAKNVPTQVPGLTGITAIAGGGYHSLALTGGGAVFAWGENNFGQLGDGTNTNRSNPTLALLTGSLSLTGVSAISAGIYHSVFLGGGVVYGVGYNGYGQLGDGTTTDRTAAVPTTLTNVQTIAAGSYHTLAVLNGSLYAWGQNSNGQLGDGTNTNRSVPTSVAPAYKAYAISGGGSDTVFIQTPLRSVSGTLNFEQIAPTSNNQDVLFVFVPSFGATITRLASVPLSGVFTVPGIPQGAYTVWIKGTKYLAATAAANTSNGNVVGLSLYQAAGDANNDNSVDSTDFGLLIGDFGANSAVAGSGYEENVDLNGDGSTDSTDFGLLIGEFNINGAPLP